MAVGFLIEKTVEWPARPLLIEMRAIPVRTSRNSNPHRLHGEFSPQTSHPDR